MPPPPSKLEDRPVTGSEVSGARGSELAASVGVAPTHVQTPRAFPGPAKTMADATRACDVAQPLESNDPRWQNFADARGDDAVAVLRRTFQRKAPGTSQQVLFVSHRGAGKSTELKRFCGDLDQQYQALYLEANMELDPFTIEGEDLLLMLAQAVEEKMRQIGLPLPSELCERVERWFRSVIKETSLGTSFEGEVSAGIELDAKVPLLGRLFGSVKALLKVDSEHRTKIKDELRKHR